jgi:DNA-binding response OmpR family regulator
MRIAGAVARPVQSGEERETVLVVNADPLGREALSDLLGSAGFATREAATGFEALVTARQSRPSAVLLNVTLPSVTGYDVCRSLRDEFGEDLPIILLSGERTEVLDRIAGLLIGADDYVVEPFDAEELLARVRRSLERAKSVRQLPGRRHLSALLP